MSICSDIFITEEKARQMVRDKLLSQQVSLIEAVLQSPQNTATKEELLSQQTSLIDLAVAAMPRGELTWVLNDGSEDLYFYNLESEDEEDDSDE